MNGIRETFGLISEAINTMVESGSDWSYTLAGALLFLTVVAHCAIEIPTWIGDNVCSGQQKYLSRLSSPCEAKKSHPDVLLEAEIGAEKAKANRYDVWYHWRQEEAQKHRNELIENRTSRRKDSFFFTPFFLLLLPILWVIPFLLKYPGLLSPGDSSALGNIKKENLPSVVFLLVLLVLPTIWIPVYIVAYRLYWTVKEANNPVSMWGFSWISASMLLLAMTAASIETATRYTVKLLVGELTLVAIATLSVPLSSAVGYIIDYITDRWRSANRPNLEDRYHDSLSSRRDRYISAIFNFVFCLCFLILLEVLYFESTIDNIYVLVVFVVILSPAAFLSIIVSLLRIISSIREDEFALHGYHVIFHNGQKREGKIMGYGLSVGSTYYQPPGRKRKLIFEGWNMQEDGHGVNIKDADDFDVMAPEDKCGEIKLYTQ